MTPKQQDPSLIPPNPWDDRRWQEQRRRRRIQTGAWRTDLDKRLALEVGVERTDAWGITKQTSNVFATVNRELATLHVSTPLVRLPSGQRLDQSADAACKAFAAALTASGLWQRQIEFQPLVLACQEYLWRVHVDEQGEISMRPVPPDVMEIEPENDDASEPYRTRELRWRPQVKAWCWDVICAAEREYLVERYDAEGKPGEDVTAQVLGKSFSGDKYPYLDPAGAPVLPYVLYHATALGDQLWHVDRGIETVEACLDLAVLYTFLGHVMKSASWPQRWSLNAVVASMEGGDAALGLQVVGASPYMNTGIMRERAITDPALLLQFVQPPDAQGQPQIGQWTASADPVAMESVISAMANRVAVEAGLPPTDIQRLGGTARSGYAISLSNEGKRTTARRYAPAFHGPDAALVTMLAQLWSARTGQPLPVGAWDIEYQDLPLSPDELRERRADVIETMGAGLLDRTGAYMELNPGTTRAQALQDLANIDAETARRAALITTPRMI